MAKSKPRVKMPNEAEKNDIIEIKALLKHKMESGRRRDKKTGKLIPRQIINRFTASFEGAPVFDAELHPSMTGNLLIKFFMKVVKSGVLKIKWVDDDGTIYNKELSLTVKG